jgi:predicted transcriptional regulator
MKGEKTVVPETDRNSHEIDRHLTARIVESYVRHHAVGTGQVSELITSVHGALARLGRPSQPEEVLIPAVSIRQSVRHEYVVCLDCGCRAKTLRRHISTRHSLSPDEYLKRWGLRRDHPLTAPAYTEQRSTMAKALGLGRKRKAQVAPARTSAVPASADSHLRSAEEKPTRRRGTRPAPKSEVVSQAAAALPPARKRSSRVTPRG